MLFDTIVNTRIILGICRIKISFDNKVMIVQKDNHHKKFTKHFLLIAHAIEHN